MAVRPCFLKHTHLLNGGRTRMASQRPSRCPGTMDRRSWLKIGGLSLGALVTGVNPSLARLFAGEAAGSERGRLLNPEFSAILVFAHCAAGPNHDLFPPTAGPG